jgi:glucose-1-phosphate cytidylyltransferase
MKCVILAGGLGTRLREETEFKPKPLVEIGGKPIIWHLIKYYEKFNINDFIVCAGYKGEMIEDYFNRSDEFINSEVNVVHTGELSNTGERLRLVKDKIGNETFYCTYGDGLSDVDLESVLELHYKNGRITTLCTTRPTSRFGVVEIDENNLVSGFREKPLLDSWINIGFFIFNSDIFHYINKNSTLEIDVLTSLAAQNQISAYKHHGYWQPMDTYRESMLLNRLWDEKKAPWKIWD